VPQAGYSLPAGVTSNEPARGLVSLNFELLPAEVGPAIVRAREIVEAASPAAVSREPDAADPDSLFAYYLENLLGDPQPGATAPGRSPLLLVVSGDIEPETVLRQLEAGFGDLPGGTWEIPGPAEPAVPVEIESRVTNHIAQERLGYVARVPGPHAESAAAWQITLYILSHGYEGRLGKKAISDQGLVYYIESAYQTDGGNDWITLSMGVDPAKLPAVKQLLKEELQRLLEEPPSQAEIDEAKAHLLGRHVSASQSNTELADSLTRQWIRNRDPAGGDEWEKQLDAVQRKDILDLLPEFTRGSIIAIRNPEL
jgi:predicted Zn-dependent peptidase